MKSFYLLLIFCFTGINCFCQSYNTNSNVEILEGHTWYQGKILEVKGDKYKIHYSRFNNDLWDIWVGKERLRTAIPAKNLPINNRPVSGIGILYSGSSGMGGSVYLYMYPSGHIVNGCPTGGLEKFNYNAFCATSKNSCGTYIKKGNTINIIWSSGDSWSGSIKSNGDMEINSSLYGVAKKVPSKLSSNYEFTLNSNGVSVAEVLKFKADGTFDVSRASGYDHNDGKNSAEWQSNNSGKYVINGYTITIIDNKGKSTSHTIYALESTKNPDFLGWDGNYLSRSK